MLFYLLSYNIKNEKKSNFFFSRLDMDIFRNWSVLKISKLIPLQQITPHFINWYKILYDLYFQTNNIKNGKLMQ